MPNRVLREGILESERIDRLPPMAELFYRRLMSVVDDFGRYSCAVRVLLSRCFPTRPEWADEELITSSLHHCEQVGLLRIYSVDSRFFLELLDFRQQVRANKSKYPSLEEGCLASATQMTSTCNLSTADSRDEVYTTPTPSSTPIPEKKETLRVSVNAFELLQEKWFTEEFWPIYWRRVDRKDALKAFQKHAKTEALKDRIVSAVAAHREHYCRRDPEHRPHAATWLNAERYDELAEDAEPVIHGAPKSRLERIMDSI